MGLDLYRKKRNFKTTPEPAGRVHRTRSRAPRFVIQKHAASHLHYDFRLELNGVLLSWAVPKGPSLDPHDKRLAMHVEDHPIEYGDFEGVIPPKQYGSGTVLLWDRGTWSPVGDAEASYRQGKLKFELHGEKLHGGWVLVKSHGGKYDREKSWLLIKEEDEHARVGADARIVDTEPDSVASGRSLEAIAADPDRVWHSNKSVAENMREGRVERRNVAVAPGKVAGARKAALPETLGAELATLVDRPPEGDEWVHEIKFDGYRMLARIDKGKCRIVSRNGKDWTASFPTLVDALARLPVTSAWIDGEIVVMDSKGRTSFQSLQNVLSEGGAAKLVYCVFDLPFVNGYDLRNATLTARKELLARIAGPTGSVRYSDHVVGNGANFFAEACRVGLEGIVSKRAGSTYQATRGRDWQKVKCGLRQEFVVGGYTDPQGARTGFGALLLGVHDDGELRYCGKVGTGFNDAMLKSLKAKLADLAADETPFVNPPTGAEGRRAHWVKPQLVAEVAFTEWTRDGTLRHPSFQGLREDKPAREIVREAPVHDSHGDAGGDEAANAKSRSRSRRKAAAATPAPAKAAAKRTAKPAGGGKEARSEDHAARRGANRSREKAVSDDDARAGKRGGLRNEKKGGHDAAATKRNGDGSNGAANKVARVAISNGAKVLYPEAGITKLELARYYEAVGDVMVPHLRDRPLTLVRCPNGWDSKCFYQKHANESISEFIERIDIRDSGGVKPYMMANSTSAVVALLQMGVLELHPWGSRAPKLGYPDRLVFDFDPDEALAFDKLVDAITVLRKLLDALELEAFLKTTGGKGLHVVIPLEPVRPWDDAKEFCRGVAELLVRTFPDRFTAKMTKSRRGGLIFVDYLRNVEGATAVAPYSVRAKARAPVAMPIDWSELARDVRFDHYNIRNVPALLARRRRDPWARMPRVRQALTDAMLAQVDVRAAAARR